MKLVFLKYVINPKEILHDLISIPEVLTALSCGTSYILKCLIKKPISKNLKFNTNF